MSKKATKAADNVMYQARMEAAEYNDRLSSRESAAEIVGIERTRLAHIELGTVYPHPDEIAIMSEMYNAPELRNHYCSQICPLGRKTVEAVEMKELEATTLQLLSSLRKIPLITDSLIDIVEDGVIDDNEKPDMEEILKVLKKVAVKIKTLELVYEKLIANQ